MLIHPLKGYGGGGARSAGYLVQVESDIPDIHRHSLVCVVDLKSGICGLRSHHMCVCGWVWDCECECWHTYFLEIYTHLSIQPQTQLAFLHNPHRSS